MRYLISVLFDLVLCRPKQKCRIRAEPKYCYYDVNVSSMNVVYGDDEFVHRV